MSSNSSIEQVTSGIDQQIGDGSNEPDIESRSVLAYLGPAGTYSHQAAHDRFAETVDYQPRNTISGLCRTQGVLTSRVVRGN